jgi:hypothetical protein
LTGIYNLPFKMSKKPPTPTQLKVELCKVELERDNLKEELGSVNQELSDTTEQLLAAQRRIRELEQEQTSHDVQGSIKTFLLFLLSAAPVWVARLPEPGLAACCPSSSIAPLKFQAWLCSLLQSAGGELKIFALIIWVSTMISVLLGQKFDSLLAIAGPAISLCVFLDTSIIMAIVVLVLVYFCYLVFFDCTTNSSSQTNPAYEVDRYNGANEVAIDGSVIDRT